MRNVIRELKNQGVSSNKVDIASVLKDSSQDEEVSNWLKSQLMSHEQYVVMEKEKDKEGIKLTQCARCYSVCYCSKECQAKDWKEGKHKEDCKKV